MNDLSYGRRKFIDWIFRARSAGLAMMKAGVLLVVASLTGGGIAKFGYQGRASSFYFDFNSANGVVLLSIVSFCVGMILIGIGLWRDWLSYTHEVKRIEKKRVIIIEQRGLRDTTDTPLINYIPDSFEGHRDQLLNDIRERIKDGSVTAPEAALEKICFIKRELQGRIGRTDIVDVKIVYGGLLPVPFTFLTGMLLDDESRIVTFDWDRVTEKWRLLDAEDDGCRFIIDYDSTEIKDEMVVAVSVSYKVDIDNVKLSFPKKPILHLYLPQLTSENHWSKDKQDALAAQFFEAVKDVMSRGVKKIHLIIAAQNSVVFRLGRIYDKRNLPDAIIYQYERSKRPAYPWGVRLPSHGVAAPQIVTNNCNYYR